MSLIYQALQRIAQDSPAEAGVGQPTTMATPGAQAGATTKPRVRGALWLGIGAGTVIAAAWLVGMPLLQAQTSQTSPRSVEAEGVAQAAPVVQTPPPTPPAPIPVMSTTAPTTAPLVPLPKAFAVPDAEVHRPVMMLRPATVDPVVAEPAAAARAFDASAAPDEPRGVVKVTPSAQAAAQKQNNKAGNQAGHKQASRSENNNPSTSGREVAAHFHSLNQALAQGDHTAAGQHLKAIQAGLPAGTVARLRAEAWTWFQTGELERAQGAYQSLLDKVPGDENAALNLVSLLQQRKQPEEARRTLVRALASAPNSANLRRALQQLDQNGASQ